MINHLTWEMQRREVTDEREKRRDLMDAHLGKGKMYIG